MRRLLRLKAIVPLALVLVLMGIGWALLVDGLVERSIEDFGTMLVGAQVDVADADLRIRDGALVLRGLEVTNPDQPMTNLFSADEIVANLALRPLLEKKVVIDTMAARGLAFGSARATSGALEQPSEASEQTRGLIAQWADRVRVPPLSFEGLASAVDIGALSEDSLESLQLARATVERADRFRDEWEEALANVDPGPHVDSARSLVRQLQSFNPLRLGPVGIANLANNSRTALQSLESVRSNLVTLDSTSRAGIVELQSSVQALDDARRVDYAYARGLMQLPSLDAPDLSTSIFGDAVIAWVRPVLYWAQMAERFIPPGLDPRNRPGARRARHPGTDVDFPGQSTYPSFLLRHGEIDLTLGGTGAAAGAYSAVVQGLTTQPTVYGRPMELRVGRGEGAAGPDAVNALAILDHVASPTSDSLAVGASGVTLPTFELASLGARLVLGEGTTRMSLGRHGAQFAGTIGWDASAVGWERLSAAPATDVEPAIGSAAWAEGLLWRTVSGLEQVRVDVQLGGTITDPTFGITSTVGDAIAGAIQRELGREIEQAEQRLRGEVDRLVNEQIGRARSTVESLAADVSQRIGIPLAELDEVEAELRREIERRLP